MSASSPPQYGRRAGATMPGAGERRVREERVTGKFPRPQYAERPPVAADRTALEAAGSPVKDRDEELDSIANDFHHISGYTGHKPRTWAPHSGRDNFGIHEGVNSKSESYIAKYGRPPMESGAAFAGNPRLNEGAPKLNANGLFKTDIEDEIDQITRSQPRTFCSSAFASLRSENKERTLGSSADSSVGYFDGSPQKLDKTLNKDPEGYSVGFAKYSDENVFQGSFPTSRHIPGYSGHIPGGIRT